MPSFDVLDRNQLIHRHAFLEASAGTGKTFAIENVVVRLLMGGNAQPLDLERILVVTFTKASTRDLKARVRQNLEVTLNHLESFLNDRPLKSKLPDYLLECLENGKKSVALIKQKIEQALFIFDSAQIFTIHGFCWRMLKNYAVEAGVSLAAVSAEQGKYSKTKLLQVVRDFLRTELTEASYSLKQLDIILNHCGSIEQLQGDIFNLIAKGMDIVPLDNATQLFLRFQSEMEAIKKNKKFESSKIITDFFVQAPAYNKLTIKNTNSIKPEIMQAVERFAAFFDKTTWHKQDFDWMIEKGLVLVDLLSPENRRKRAVKGSLEPLNYPDLLATLQEKLGPIIKLARDPEAILACMAKDCQKLMRHYQQQEEMIGHNDLLQQMLKATDSSEFSNKVRSGFDAVIIDEFQDTDPIQWKIFQRLFIGKDKLWNGFLYLVGDPKQSIYAFRQADIYTYLSAADMLGAQTWATLDTNFRSCPQLVEALNTLFLSAKNLFPLPYRGNNLTYQSVKAGKKESEDKGTGSCLQFWLPQIDQKAKKNISLYDLESKYFFPAIVDEVIRLNREEGIHLRQCAVLVADRYQAERLVQYFKQSSLPFVNQRGEDLRKSLAVHAMRDLLKGILNYQHESSLKLALASKIVGFTYDEIASFNLGDSQGNILGQCHHLHHVLVNEGVAVFFSELLQSIWHMGRETVLERILRQHDGLEFYREWQDVVDLLIEEQANGDLSANELVVFLDNLDEFFADNEGGLRATVDYEEEGVSILTSHLSKGLEFDAVFALGLIKRPKKPNKLIPVQRGDHSILVFSDVDDVEYQKYCEELDAEKMRQLYVALTRAKLHVYLPADLQPLPKVLNVGEASPMDLLIARLSNEGSTLESYYEHLYSCISKEDGSSLRDFVKNCSADITLREVHEQVAAPIYLKQFKESVLLSPKTVIVPGKPLFVQSFTSLAQTGATVQEVAMEEEKIVPSDFSDEIPKCSHHLPAGCETGILLHEILENIAFANAKLWEEPADACSEIKPFLKDTAFVEWEEIIASMVFNAFKTPLPGSSGGFSLSEVDPRKVFRETEFLYSTDIFEQDGEQLVDNTGIQPGFIKGVIDLFFEHEGKYYLLDWKSNWLGMSQESYQGKKMLEAMLQHNYHLQASIYAEAMRRYLRLFDKRPFESIFGGAYYLFLRGISPTSGIYHFHPSKEV